MKQIRINVFETNSSSTHSICIAKNPNIRLPNELYFKFGEFGWEERSFDSIEEKASYLYTGLYNNEMHSEIEEIVDYLTNKGITVTCEKPVTKSYTNYSYEDTGYVDHGDKLKSWLYGLVENKHKILDFLCSPLSFVITGNDNNDSDVSINVTYPHEKYYKGN